MKHSRHVLALALVSAHLSSAFVAPRLELRPATMALEAVLQEQQIRLDTGIQAQVLSSKPPSSSTKPPLLFIHGSFHAAWCWAEKYFDYFADLGYPVAALSLRGTGSSFAGEEVKKVKIEEHVEDVRSFIRLSSDIVGSSSDKPVLISHSFGGVTVMKLLDSYPDLVDELGGVVTMCSVPPSGNSPMTMRFLRKSLRASWIITVGFVLKRAMTNDSVARILFFGGEKSTLPDGTVEDFGVSDADIQRYQGYFERDTDAVIDVVSFQKVLPSLNAVDGVAPFAARLPPCLVVGAERDFVVDRPAVEETATYLGVDEALFIDSSHDVMLGRDWQNGANAIHDFVQTKVAK